MNMEIWQWAIIVLLIEHTFFNFYHLFTHEKRSKKSRQELVDVLSVFKDIQKAFDSHAKSSEIIQKNFVVLNSEVKYALKKLEEK